MSDDLFFMPILEQAFRQADVESALRGAFDQIQTLGRQQRYERGYQQFARFMHEAGKADPREAAERILGQFSKEFQRPDVLDIVIEQGDRLIATCSFGAAPGRQVVDGIKPAVYRVRLDTGRVLWEGLLADEDLTWAKAFPGESLRMAADTGDERARPSRQIPVLDGSIVLRVCPGIEHGALEVEWVNP